MTSILKTADAGRENNRNSVARQLFQPGAMIFLTGGVGNAPVAGYQGKVAAPKVQTLGM